MVSHVSNKIVIQFYDGDNLDFNPLDGYDDIYKISNEFELLEILSQESCRQLSRNVFDFFYLDPNKRRIEYIIDNYYKNITD